MMRLNVSLGGRTFSADMNRAFDLSIPLRFGGPQPNHFGAPAATAAPLEAGGFTGDTRQGGSCNCEILTLVPHCNGTHTECVGHVTDERMPVADVAPKELLHAILLTVEPVRTEETRESSAPRPEPGDLLITRSALGAAAGSPPGPLADALVVRTLPNSPDKRHRQYTEAHRVPYFTSEAMEWLVQRGVRHLIVDTPSIDRMHDEGALTGHRIFWGLPPSSRDIGAAARPDSTVTELAFVPDDAVDGSYLLNLQVAPFATDAAPCRPLLYALGRPES